MGEKGKPYNPMGVLGMLKSKGVPVPIGKDFGKRATLTDASGTPVFDTPKVPETCPLLLLAFTNGSKLVPDDFFNLPKSGKALKEYVRPDGGVYLGAFQAAGESDGVVVVFGDPAMSQENARNVAMHYRARLIERYEGEVAMDQLGPFAAGAVSETPPAVFDSEKGAPT